MGLTSIYLYVSIQELKNSAERRFLVKKRDKQGLSKNYFTIGIFSAINLKNFSKTFPGAFMTGKIFLFGGVYFFLAF